jgi:hypothetical protein
LAPAARSAAYDRTEALPMQALAGRSAAYDRTEALPMPHADRSTAYARGGSRSDRTPA